MAAQGTVDIRSIIIGALVGVVIFLVGIGLWRRAGQEVVAPVDTITAESDRADAAMLPAGTGLLGPAQHFELKQRVEKSLGRKAQSMLDGIVGRARSSVRIDVALDLSHRSIERRIHEPRADEIVLNEETSESQSAAQGSRESAVRSYAVDRETEDIVESGNLIRRLTMAVTVDKTKVIHDVETNSWREIDRPQEEIDQLRELMQQAVGFDNARGDEVTIYALRFDKSQAIQAKEAVIAIERRGFWTKIAKIAAILVALLVLRRFLRRADATGLMTFLKERDTQVALFIAVGVFLCAHALRLWGGSLSWGELGALPGLFFLILGAARIRRRSPAPPSPETT